MSDFITWPGHLGLKLHRTVSTTTTGTATPDFCKPVLSFPSFSHLPEAAGTKEAHSLIILYTWEWDLQKPTNPNIQGIVHELPKAAREESAGETGVLQPPPV